MAVTRWQLVHRIGRAFKLIRLYFFPLKMLTEKNYNYVVIIWEKRAWLAFKQLMVLPCKFKKSFIFILLTLTLRNLSETSYGVWLILREFMEHSLVHNDMMGKYYS